MSTIEVIEDGQQESEGVRSIKTFRKSKELEDLYRFINENGMRREALQALEFISARMNVPKKKRGRKSKSKKLQ